MLKYNPIIFKVWRYISKKRKIQFSFMLLIMMLSGISELFTLTSIIPFLTIIASPQNFLKFPITKFFSNLLGIYKSEELIIPIVILFGIAAISTSIIRLINIWLNYRYGAAIASDLSLKVYETILYQPYEYHLENNSSKTTAAVTLYIDGVVESVGSFMQILTYSIVVISLFVGMLFINSRLAFYSIFLYGFLYLILGKTISKELNKNSKIMNIGKQKVFKYIQEGLGSVKMLILNCNQIFYLNKFTNVDRDIRIRRARNKFFAYFPRFAIEGISLTLIAFLTGFIVLKESNKTSTLIIILGGFALAAQRLLPSIQAIYGNFSLMQTYRADLLSIIKILELKNFTKKNPNIKKFNFKKSIYLDSVSFSYKNKSNTTLSNINLEIHKGEKIGIIGKSGSGKSTLIDIIIGILIPTKGRIFIDNKNLYNLGTKNSRLNSWRSSISYIPQDIFLADTSILENIAFGIPKHLISMERVLKVARIAQIKDFIESKSSSYQTIIGEKGIQLSGGQRQRIAIARALYENKKIIVLDEATSSLDIEIERNFIKELFNFQKDKTIIFISHRESTLSNCDKIIKINNGKIISIGSPREIL